MALKVKMKVAPLLAELTEVHERLTKQHEFEMEQWNAAMELYAGKIQNRLVEIVDEMRRTKFWEDPDLERPWQFNRGNVTIHMEDIEAPKQPPIVPYRLESAIRLLTRSSQSEIWVEEGSDIDRVLRDVL